MRDANVYSQHPVNSSAQCLAASSSPCMSQSPVCVATTANLCLSLSFRRARKPFHTQHFMQQHLCMVAIVRECRGTDKSRVRQQELHPSSSVAHVDVGSARRHCAHRHPLWPTTHAHIAAQRTCRMDWNNQLTGTTCE